MARTKAESVRARRTILIDVESRRLSRIRFGQAARVVLKSLVEIHCG